MEDMVDFFYSGKIEISELNVQDLLHIACLLQVQSVKKACCEFLKRQLSPENCIGKLLLWYPHVQLHKVWHYIQKTSDNNEMQWGIKQIIHVNMVHQSDLMQLKMKILQFVI